jgi:FixJ family two-component response regulator
MSEINHCIYVIDSDPRMRGHVLRLLAAYAMSAVAFDEVDAFLAEARPDLPGCLILGSCSPAPCELSARCQQTNLSCPPIIYITRGTDVLSAVRVMRAGAVDVLTRPVSKDALLAAVHAGLSRDREDRFLQQELQVLRQRQMRLTSREVQVFELVVEGKLNKQSAWELGISQSTLQAHRGRLMHKMKARSLADLVRMASMLGLTHWGVDVRSMMTRSAQ